MFTTYPFRQNAILSEMSYIIGYKVNSYKGAPLVSAVLNKRGIEETILDS